MAAKTIARVVDWAALSLKVPHNSRAEISALRSAYEAAKQKFEELESLPATPAAINWDQYRSSISAPDYVDTVKSTYESIKFTYPEDKLGAVIETSRKEAQAKADALIAAADKHVKELEAGLAAIKAEKPVEDVTLEEYFENKKDLRAKYRKQTDAHNYL